MNREELVRLLNGLGVTRFGFVRTSELVFSNAFREACEANTCGQYGSNWACPPGVGPVAALMDRARQFSHGLVIQTVWPLEDEFDFDGMMAAKDKHAALFRRSVDVVESLLPAGKRLALSAGPCDVCASCAYLAKEPCRSPDRAMSSLEAYGIDVAALIARAGLSYSNGSRTVSYVGLILY